MKGIIHFIDNNYGLLENHIFLSICWNMIYFANKANNFDISYLSELKLPSSYCFSYLGNELDLLKQNHSYVDFLKYNPNLVLRSSHLELYNLIYYSELKHDNQIDYFFEPRTEEKINNINYIGNHEFYKITFNCNSFNSRTLNKNIVSMGFSKFHPFYIDSFNNDIIKMRAVTHKPIGSGLCHKIGTTSSYIMKFTYDVPKSFIQKMDIYDKPIYPIDLNVLIKNSNLVNMPNQNIDTLKLAINGNFNYHEPLIEFNSCNIKDNIDYLEHFNELNYKLKYNTKLKFDAYKEKQISELSLAIQKKWK